MGRRKIFCRTPQRKSIASKAGTLGWSMGEPVPVVCRRARPHVFRRLRVKQAGRARAVGTYFAARLESRCSGYAKSVDWLTSCSSRHPLIPRTEVLQRPEKAKPTRKSVLPVPVLQFPPHSKIPDRGNTQRYTWHLPEGPPVGNVIRCAPA